MTNLKNISRLAGLVLLVLLLSAVFQNVANAQDNGPRYMIMQNQFVFERIDELPYQIIGPMCWNDTDGWCDPGMDEAGHRLVYLIDFETARHGVIMQNSVGCWLWWFFPTYGNDNNPHIEEDYWISCPTELTSVNGN